MNTTRYDDLYVISDLHMGGRPGFQIMNRGPRLGRFIQQLAVRPDAESERRVGLVINGDAIDTLSEKLDGYIAVTEAEQILERLFRDEAFEPVWSALAVFVRQPHRRLVFIIGNHDIELSLPVVQHSIRSRLAGGDAAAVGRIEFAVEGTGYSCHVGNLRVFCTHGNEVDGWNVINHEALRQLVRDQNAGMPFNAAAWTPNAGTRLVRDVMNEVKRRHPWVDLLKPEKNVVLGVLLTIDPTLVRTVLALMPIAWRRGIGELQSRGVLSARSHPDAATAAEAGAWRDAVGPRLWRLIDGGDASGAMARPEVAVSGLDPMLLEIERQLASGIAVADTPDDLTGTLGWPRMVLDRLRSVDKVDALRQALLDWLDDDHSFELTEPDETYRRTLTGVGPDVDVIVTGHTHLERAIVSASRAYYNTGTWIRVIRFPDAVLKDAARFMNLYKLIGRASLADLDDATVTDAAGRESRLVTDVTTALQITARSGSVVACLGHVVDDDDDGVRFDTIEHSVFRGA
jgi:UDP-2,3-diacylglucosamine pyrophosphatase LpxH